MVERRGVSIESLGRLFPSLQSKKWQGMYDPVVQQRKVSAETRTWTQNSDTKMSVVSVAVITKDGIRDCENVRTVIRSKGL